MAAPTVVVTMSTGGVDVPRVLATWQQCRSDVRSLDNLRVRSTWLCVVVTAMDPRGRLGVSLERIHLPPLPFPCAAVQTRVAAKASAPSALRPSCRAQQARSAVPAALVRRAEPGDHRTHRLGALARQGLSHFARARSDFGASAV